MFIIIIIIIIIITIIIKMYLECLVQSLHRFVPNKVPLSFNFATYFYWVWFQLRTAFPDLTIPWSRGFPLSNS